MNWTRISNIITSYTSIPHNVSDWIAYPTILLINSKINGNIITKNGKEAHRISQSSFAYEANLQNFIHENPDTIPLYDIDEDIRLLILAREVPTNSGSIDAIGTDENGEVYIVETKLYKKSWQAFGCRSQSWIYGASISGNPDRLRILTSHWG